MDKLYGVSDGPVHADEQCLGHDAVSDDHFLDISHSPKMFQLS